MFVAQRFSSQRPRESVGESAGTVPILGQTLEERQEWVVLLCRGKWAEPGELSQLWIRDDVFVSEKALSTFVSLARNASGDVYWKAEGRVGNFVSEIAFGADSPMILWLQEPGEYDAERFAAANELTIDPKMQEISVPVPKSQFGVDIIELPMTDYIVLPTGHWSQVLWSNLLALGPHLWRELVGSNPMKMVWRLFICFLKARSTDPMRIGSKLMQKGSRCRIHPSAVVEGSILGENVSIGANAVVRGCVIGNDVTIEDLALVEFSVLSKGCTVQRQAMLKFSVMAERASVAGVVQMGVLGAGASVKRGAYLMDMNFAGGAKISWNGEVLKAPLGLAGCCVGEDSIIGLGVKVAAGRWIPGGVQIVADVEALLQKLPDDMAGLYQVKHGSVEKL